MSIIQPKGPSIMFTALVLLSVVLGVHAAFYTWFEDIPVKQYDFIVVGGIHIVLWTHCFSLLTFSASLGGNAGNVIANRLTKDPNVQVLVLEAGGSYVDIRMLLAMFFT
jgi:heme/copper-type cytochrome/quinol oxidase subunit 1